MRGESLAILAAAGAVCMDLRFAKVKNEWIGICLLSALAFRWLEAGWRGVGNGTAGALTALLLTGWLFVFRMLGAGDIKLLAVLGMYLGSARLLLCLWLAFVIGAVQAVWILTKNHLWKQRFLYLHDYLLTERNRFPGTSGIHPRPYRKGSVEKPENIHFTVPVFISLICISVFSLSF